MARYQANVLCRRFARPQFPIGENLTNFPRHTMSIIVRLASLGIDVEPPCHCPVLAPTSLLPSRAIFWRRAISF